MTNSKTCFVACPIGSEGSETRRWSDDTFEYLIKPTVIKYGYNPIRADHIQTPGMITNQIMEQLLEADLVIADLTDNNPNVFYELAIRHSSNRPYIQIMKISQKIPFDIHGLRTIYFDLNVAQVEKAKIDLSKQIEAIEKGDFSSPITLSSNGFFTKKEIKNNPNNVEHEDESVQKEKTANEESFRLTKNLLDEISRNVVSILNKDHIWLDRYMDEIGATYTGSIFGQRITHFAYEKKALAKIAVNFLEEKLIRDEIKKCCLLIDSGTTMYHIFCEICNKILEYQESNVENNANLDIWTNRVFIITNNLPGIQYLIKNCKSKTNENQMVNCLILPGKPLPEYAAVTGQESTKFLEEENVREIIRRRMKVEEDDYKIISFLASNYMVRHNYIENGVQKDRFCPVARRGGHYEIKDMYVKLSDEIYLISPLSKFSYATCDQLNDLNEFNINEKTQSDEAEKNPSKVMYSEIELVEEKLAEKCTFFITKRVENDMFGLFSRSLKDDLINTYGVKKVIIEKDFKLEYWIPVNREDETYRDLEIRREIPHKSLREAFIEMRNSGNFIWEQSWIARPRKRPKKDESLDCLKLP